MGESFIGMLLDQVRKWFGKESTTKCLQCGLTPGREFMIVTQESIIHPHQCSWCSSVLYVPGPMFSCKACSEGSGVTPQAA